MAGRDATRAVARTERENKDGIVEVSKDRIISFPATDFANCCRGNPYVLSPSLQCLYGLDGDAIAATSTSMLIVAPFHVCVTSYIPCQTLAQENPTS